MDGLVLAGFVVLGGPLGYDHGALLLVESADEQDIRQRLEDDPWVRAGILRVGSVERWLLWLGSRPSAD